MKSSLCSAFGKVKMLYGFFLIQWWFQKLSPICHNHTLKWFVKRPNNVISVSFCRDNTIDTFPSEEQLKWKRVFPWCCQWKDIQLDVHLHNFREHKDIHQFIHFPFHQLYSYYIWNGELSNPWPLVYVTCLQKPLKPFWLKCSFYRVFHWIEHDKSI